MAYRAEYKRNFDPLLVILPFIICSIGLVFLYSASVGMQQVKGIDFIARQATWILVSLLIVVAAINMDFRKIMDGSYLYYAIIVFVLIVLLFVGGERLGAKRWLTIGWFTFQPSEISKLILVLALSFYLGNNKYSNSTAKAVTPFVLSGALFVLIVRQPDLGSAAALMPILFGVLFAAQFPLKIIFGSAFIASACAPLFWNFLKGYQKKRLMVFLNPNIDPLGAGYTIIQSKIAVGSGGLFGKGWMSGTQNQLNFLPERHTDFIFSVVGEEWGFAGSAAVTFLYCLLILRILAVAERTNDIYGKLVVVGVASMLAFQAIINIAMTIGLMPVVGIPLPMISYGGSSMITTWLAIALVINADIRRTIF